jgi:hypothetical protein
VAGSCIRVRWILWRGESTRWTAYIWVEHQSWDYSSELTVSTGRVTIVPFKTQQKIIHIIQNITPRSKHSTQSYTNNKGHVQHSLLVAALHVSVLRPSSGFCSCIHVFKIEVTLQLTVSQSVCQGIEPTLKLVTRYYFLSEGCCLVSVYLIPCWRERDEKAWIPRNHSSSLNKQF